MHIHIIPNRNSKPAVLLRESYRVGGNVRKRTLANLSKLPMDAVDAIKRILKGEKLVSLEDAFEIVENGSRLHGHVDAVLSAMRQLGFEKLVGSRHSRERDLVMAMVAARILEPQSKLATSLWWHTTTLPEILGVSDADEDDLYAAMDWVLERQEVIEKKLAARHLQNDGLALYDLTSSYFEGVSCPIAKLGYDRDGKKGKLQVNYGLLTNERGIPVSVSVFEGNSGDPKTLLPQIEKVQERFGIEQFVMVGDRGMITQTQIDALREMDGVDWITALRPEAIRKLINDGLLQMGLFDERNLFEVTHPDFPNERLVACRNPELAERRRHKRRALLEATCKELEKVCRMVERRRLQGKENIRAAVKKLLNKYKVGSYYRLDIRDDGFDFELDETTMDADASRLASGNSELANKRLQRWKRHVETIAKQLDQIRQRIGRGQLHGKDKIGVRVGKVLNKYKVGKHFTLDIRDNSFSLKFPGRKDKNLNRFKWNVGIRSCACACAKIVVQRSRKPVVAAHTPLRPGVSPRPRGSGELTCVKAGMETSYGDRIIETNLQSLQTALSLSSGTSKLRRSPGGNIEWIRSLERLWRLEKGADAPPGGGARPRYRAHARRVPFRSQGRPRAFPVRVQHDGRAFRGAGCRNALCDRRVAKRR